MSKNLSAADLYQWLSSEKNPLAQALQTVQGAGKERRDILYLTALAYVFEIDEELVIAASEAEARASLSEAYARGQQALPTHPAGISEASRLPLYLAFKAGRLHDATGLLEFDELVDVMGQIAEKGEPIAFIWYDELKQVESKLSQQEGFDLWALTPDQSEAVDEDLISEKIILNYLCLASYLEERGNPRDSLSL